MSQPDTSPEPIEVSDRTPERSPLKAGLKIAVVFAVLGTALGLLIFGSDAGDAFVYSKLVHEVLADPAQFKDRELRVEGDLKPGSIVFREDPCEYRFVIKKENREMPVRFPQCIVPDTFKDGMGIVVTVQGKIQNDGSFLANQVIPRCPSKYEMKQREQNGEKMPHTAPGTPGYERPDPMRMPLEG
jgi:cytochrome c-type biogenesis protein CcmE